MNVAVGATIAKIASKVLQILLGDKKGRKFLGYVVGIAIFIVLLPVLAVYGLFGWMATDGADSIFNSSYPVSRERKSRRTSIKDTLTVFSM